MLDSYPPAIAGPTGSRTVLISRDINARKEAEIKFEVLASLGSRLSASAPRLMPRGWLPTPRKASAPGTPTRWTFTIAPATSFIRC